MHRLAPVALATLLAASAPALLRAQAPFTPPQLTAPFTDPANLRGERVAPLTGRELPIDKGALGLEELLRKLSTRASILNIVAHPDDEDGGMLTLYARGYGARVADLSLTRGEGGQNAMTGDFEDALGLLRTQELLANDRYTGVTQMFGTEVDFGFSKTKAESFAKWNHQRVLYDAVRAIRLFRPLVITATFIGNATDGHGQHQVSGEIAQEAFVAAGDPNVFPELTKEGILPWQPLKMYARVPTYAISAKGLFDYATGQYIPAEFTNYVTGVTSATPPTPDIVIHEGTTDPLLTTCASNPADLPPQLKSTSATPDCRPLSYVQFARIGLGLQRSQIGPGVRNARAGVFDVPYHLYGSRIQAPTARNIPAQGEALGTEHNKDEERAESPTHNPALASQPNFFSGIDTSLNGILSLDKNAPLSDAAWEHITQSIAEAQSRFNPQHPETIAPLLAEALASVDLEIDLLNKDENPSIARANLLHELRIKRVQLNDALALSLGLNVQYTVQGRTPDPSALAPFVLPQTVETEWDLDQHSHALISFLGLGSETNGAPAKGFQSEEIKAPIDLVIALDLRSGGPATPEKQEYGQYFTRPNIEQPFYNLLQPEFRNAPEGPRSLSIDSFFRYKNAHFSIPALALPSITFVPRVSVSLRSHANVFPASDSSLPVTVFIRNASQTRTRGYLHLDLPAGWTSNPSDASFDLNKSGSTQALTFQIELHHLSVDSDYTIRAVAHVGDQIFTEGFRPVGYGSLPRTNFYTPATLRIVPVDLKLPPPNKRRIGYLEGTGDDVPAALASIGLAPTMLTVADLTPEKLSHFDTVILGVRTYNAHPDLHGAPTQALLDFARSGGNVLVQYQTREFTAADAPFPLSLGSDEKVVDEADPVEILQPQATLFTTPNHIVASDFDHFFEERGHGFLASWDPRYTALTETHDPGQVPQKGGLITVQLGRGRWTYCAFALYRQLPEAVPGAFRLFTNLLTP